MPTFYRGACINSYWHLNNPIESGFTARAPGVRPSINRLMHHIARGTINSPFVSLTRSPAVAWHYAVFDSPEVPTRSNPAYIYEIEIDEPLPPGLELLDPIKEVAKMLPEPTYPGPPYQHDGLPDFVLGIVNPRSMGHFLAMQSQLLPLSEGTPRPPNLTLELETLVRAIRDAEILAQGCIPATSILNRFDVY